jgi:hypothetical protein
LVRVLPGSSGPKRPPTDGVERLLSIVRFDSREKVKDFGLEMNKKHDYGSAKNKTKTTDKYG